jgi:hypothetical protein
LSFEPIRRAACLFVHLLYEFYRLSSLFYLHTSNRITPIMLFKGLYTLLLAATAALAIETQEETIKNIVVFGDSYSDVGNKQRLTNGPLWSEHLAVGWNASLYSFAFSGAVCDNGMYPEQPSSESYIPSIIDQVEMYYKQNLQLNMKETAIVFWVGVNDVYKVFEKNEGNLQKKNKKK